ncbi:mevalonate kinase [Microbacterium sp. W1N]|uniref:mevalonate kinase n=1 Tax=Microbacterium festucae TaxID=2977531 RepID=UPI0021BEF03F|nr:mevalonate kinase [Microbacterium festucae]MCT9820233.1 mevalonate kinase [Microbacterium festucae]
MTSSASLDAPAPARGFAHPAIGRAGGKAILFGEHSVVYGHPAIAVPLPEVAVRAAVQLTTGAGRLRSALYTGPLTRAPQRLLPTVTALDAALSALCPPGTSALLEVESDIPAERGLGSSAAVAAAVISAVAEAAGVALSRDERFELIQIAERAAHGRPSGLDARAVCATQPLWFQAGAVRDLPLGAPLHLVVADTGVRGRTGEAVAAVRERLAADPHDTGAQLGELGALADAAGAQLRVGDLPAVGAAMDRAHAVLDLLGVSDPALDRLASAARQAGALGAKLTGGGRGGCVVALAPGRDEADRIAGALRRTGAAAVWTTTVPRAAEVSGTGAAEHTDSAERAVEATA